MEELESFSWSMFDAGIFLLRSKITFVSKVHLFVSLVDLAKLSLKFKIKYKITWKNMPSWIFDNLYMFHGSTTVGSVFLLIKKFKKEI